MNQTPATIFYVDDDADDLEFFEEAMRMAGKEVKLFNVPDALLRALENPPPYPSVIFTDLNMPLKSGFEILEEIRASNAFKDVPMIVYSTANDAVTVNRCHKLGASLYVTKPSSYSEIAEMVKHVLSINWKESQNTPGEFVYKKSKF